MKNFIFTAGIALILSCSAYTQTAEECIAMSSKLVELQTALEALDSNWRETKTVLEARQAEENRLLQAALKDKKNALEGIEAQRVMLNDVQQKTDDAEKRLDSLAPVLDSAAKRILKLGETLPYPLQVKLAQVFTEIESALGIKENPGDRLHAIVAASNEITSFNSGVHVVRQMLTVDGGAEMEVDVLYLGLAAAFAVTRTGSNAARGYPAETGWDWEWNKSWAPLVKNAIGIAENTKPAQLAPLPMILPSNMVSEK